MLGKNHLVLTWLSIIPVALPHATEYPVEVTLILIGSSLGSLTPDIDTRKSAILNSGRGLDNGLTKPFYLVFSFVLTPVGILIRFLALKPSQQLVSSIGTYQVQNSHRGFTHTLIGMFSLTAFVTTYLIFGSLLASFDIYRLILAIILGFSSGYLLHLVQDSLTRTGIRPLSPVSKIRIRGSYVTGKSTRKIILIYSGLILAIFLSLVISFSYNLGRLTMSVLSGGLIAGTWIGFLSTFLRR